MRNSIKRTHSILETKTIIKLRKTTGGDFLHGLWLLAGWHLTSIQNLGQKSRFFFFTLFAIRQWRNDELDLYQPVITLGLLQSGQPQGLPKTRNRNACWHRSIHVCLKPVPLTWSPLTASATLRDGSLKKCTKFQIPRFLSSNIVLEISVFEQLIYIQAVDLHLLS